MTLMNLATRLVLFPYLKYLEKKKMDNLIPERSKLKVSEMAQENSSGQDNKDRMVSGSVSTPRSWLRREHNTLTKLTSGHNTITIRTMSSRPPSREISFNTMTKITCPVEMVDGSSKVNDSIPSPQLTSLSALVKKLTIPPLWS